MWHDAGGLPPASPGSFEPTRRGAPSGALRLFGEGREGSRGAAGRADRPLHGRPRRITPRGGDTAQHPERRYRGPRRARRRPDGVGDGRHPAPRGGPCTDRGNVCEARLAGIVTLRRRTIRSGASADAPSRWHFGGHADGNVGGGRSTTASGCFGSLLFISRAMGLVTGEDVLPSEPPLVWETLRRLRSMWWRPGRHPRGTGASSSVRRRWWRHRRWIGSERTAVPVARLNRSQRTARSA